MSSLVMRCAVLVALLCTSSLASAVDGCKFLLCIAGPWQSIALCTPTVLAVFRDLARGKAFPTCDTSGEGNSAGNQWTTEATCPEMYRRYNEVSGAYAGCIYRGRIDVYIDDEPWSTVYWDMFGTSTWYGDYAREKLSSDMLDPKFDQDQAAWDAAHPDEPPDGGGEG